MSKTITLRGGIGNAPVEFETSEPAPRPRPVTKPGRLNVNTLTCDEDEDGNDREETNTPTPENEENETMTTKTAAPAGTNGKTTSRIRVKPGTKTDPIAVPKTGTTIITVDSPESKVVTEVPPPPPGFVETKTAADPIKAAGNEVIAARATKISKFLVSGGLLVILVSTILFGPASIVLFVGMLGLSVFFGHPLQEKIANGLHKVVSVNVWMRAGLIAGQTAGLGLSVLAGVIPLAAVLSFTLLISLGIWAVVKEIEDEMHRKEEEVRQAIKETVVVETTTTTTTTTDEE